MHEPSDPTLRALLGELDDLWRCLDEVCATLTPRDWSRQHGRDWVVADLPYHLAYFDRELIVKAIVRGSAVPAAERRSLRTMAEVHAWNAGHFARRPAGTTPEQALAAMRASRARLRDATGVLTGADLDRPVWCPLPGLGWQPVRFILALCIGHTWSHLTELCLRLRRDAGAPGPAAVRRALGYFAATLPLTLDRAAAVRIGTFTLVLAFAGPGGTAWTYRIAGETCAVAEGADAAADLTMTQRPETFVALLTNLRHPLPLLLTGRVRVRGFRRMGDFGKLFPTPQPDTVFPAPAADQPRPDLAPAR